MTQLPLYDWPTCEHGNRLLLPCAACEQIVREALERFEAGVERGAWDAEGYKPKERKPA